MRSDVALSTFTGSTATAVNRTQRAPLVLHKADDIERERHLIERIRAGDREAFGSLVERYLPRALGVAFRILRHTEDAEDLVQDAFLAALQHLDDFDADRPFWPWLSRILVNRGLDRAASRAVRATSALLPDVPDTREATDAAAERSEIAERFRRALDAMPPRQRLVVHLFELDGLSVGEIAATLGSSPSTVRWHLHVGRRQLRSALAPFQEGV